jgi:hypothetical protein
MDIQAGGFSVHRLLPLCGIPLSIKSELRSGTLFI